MLQNVAGELVYVVEFDTMPELPITGRNEVEGAYADVLTKAISTGIISEPGKYGINIDWNTRYWNVYRIEE